MEAALNSRELCFASDREPTGPAVSMNSSTRSRSILRSRSLRAGRSARWSSACPVFVLTVLLTYLSKANVRDELTSSRPPCGALRTSPIDHTTKQLFRGPSGPGSCLQKTCLDPTTHDVRGTEADSDSLSPGQSSSEEGIRTSDSVHRPPCQVSPFAGILRESPYVNRPPIGNKRRGNPDFLGLFLPFLSLILFSHLRPFRVTTPNATQSHSRDFSPKPRIPCSETVCRGHV